MIAVTGAAGKTGRAVLRALAERDAPARAIVHRDEQGEAVRRAGAAEVAAADLRDADALAEALAGVRVVYHIGPNLHPDEQGLGEAVITAGERAGVARVVLHSVLHPQTEAMPHHWRKLRLEERLVASDLAATVLQPAAYAQNLAPYVPEMAARGRLRLPYRPEARIALVDLDDVAEVAARVVLDDAHAGATYQLCGAAGLSQHDIAAAATRVLGRAVAAEAVDLDAWEARARAGGLDADRAAALRAMFAYYDAHGLPGNTGVLAWLLGRAPTPPEATLARMAIAPAS